MRQHAKAFCKFVFACVQAISLNKGGPSSIFGHSAVTVPDNSGFITYGGQYANDNLVDCMWYFNINKQEWQKVPIKSQTYNKPASRFFHGAAAIAMPRVQKKHDSLKLDNDDFITHTVIVGGSTSTPLVTCTAEAWLMSVNHYTHQQTWKRLPSLPYGIYYHKAVVHNQTVYVSGGHLCTETKGDKPHFYLNHVLRLDLQPWIAASKLPFADQIRRRTELRF